MTTSDRGGQRDRDDLAKTNDPELAKQRDLLEGGQSYPPIEIRRSFPLDGEFEIRVDKPLEVPVATPLKELTANGLDVRRFVAVQCRSTGHNGEFELAVHLGAAGEFPTTIEAKDERFVAIVGFFDHVDDSHAAEVQCVDSPLGHFVLDITRALQAMSRNNPDSEPTIQFQLVTPEFREPSTHALQLSGLSIVELAG
jgi:hypothetical protein